MNEEQFKQALQELYDKNQKNQYTPKELADIQHQFAYILQSFLWEGNAVKKLNNIRYRKLAILWHTDKLTPGSHQEPFVTWYMKINGQDQASLFKVLSNVKEKYRPELRFRIKEANDESFHFFGAFAKHLPLIYNVFWPIFYALEALERNIDNYSDKYRLWAKGFYLGSVIVPFVFMFIILKLEGRALEQLIELITYQMPWFGSILSSGTLGLSFVGMSFYLGLKLAAEFKKIDFSEDLLSVLFYQIPMTPVFDTFQAFKRTIENENVFKRKLFSFGKLALASLAALAQVAFTAYGMHLALPLLGTFGLLPLSGLILANLPLVVSQLYYEPKNSLILVGEYFFTIVNRYHSLARNCINYLSNAFELYFPKDFITKLSHRFRAPVAEADKAPEKIEFEPPVPVSVPYWKTKFDKYMSKDTNDITIKRRSLKKQRNDILNAMNIGENHPFRDKLDDLISQKSVDYDANGFVQDNASDKQYPIFEALNLKTQVLFLNNALQKKTHLPQSLFVAKYPQDLDYHKLIAKNTLS